MIFNIFANFCCITGCRIQMFLFHLIQENRESLEQFFAEYGEAGKKVFEEDTDDDDDKETIEEEGNVYTLEEEKYVKEILQGSDSVK